MIPIQEIEIRTKNNALLRVVIEKGKDFTIRGEFLKPNHENGLIASTEKTEEASPAIIKFIQNLSTALKGQFDEITDIHFPCNDEFNVIPGVKEYAAKSGIRASIRKNLEEA
jgi:hypothetical protein